MIRVTDHAAEHLRELLASKGESAAEVGLRLMVQRGGCAGLQYAMKIDRPRSDDEVVKRDGLQFMVDPDSLPFLKNCEIDYTDALNDSGFRIVNPNAARSCGCGTSFEPAAATALAAPAVPDGQACSSESKS